MKLSKKSLIALLGIWVLLISWAGTYAAFAIWHFHHNHRITHEFWTWEHAKLLSGSFEKLVTPMDDTTDLGKDIPWYHHEQKYRNLPKEALENTQQELAENLKHPNKKRWDSKELEAHKKWKVHGFLWHFIDSENLSDEELASLEKLQENKKEAMDTLVKKMASATEEEKAAIEEEIQAVNTKFLSSIRSFVQEDLLDEFDSFTTELPKWNDKAAKIRE